MHDPRSAGVGYWNLKAPAEGHGRWPAVVRRFQWGMAGECGLWSSDFYGSSGGQWAMVSSNGRRRCACLRPESKWTLAGAAWL